MAMKQSGDLALCKTIHALEYIEDAGKAGDCGPFQHICTQFSRLSLGLQAKHRPGKYFGCLPNLFSTLHFSFTQLLVFGAEMNFGYIQVL
jgi:hypothetical protein